MQGWASERAPVIERGEGVWLTDTDGRRYIDGVSSLWCNVHGHRHPAIDAAVRAQLDRVAHTTMLGLSHRPAEELARPAGRARAEAAGSSASAAALTRVFYSDNGSTAVEVALKMAFQYWQQAARHDAPPRAPTFVSLEDAYHGDTLGSVSVGGIELFHSLYRPLLFDSSQDARPATRERARRQRSPHHGDEIAAVVVEPLVQGAAGMMLQPPGYLRAVRELCDRHDVFLICDEVATGFGRTGTHVRVRAGGRGARLPLPRQGPDRRLPAARRDADDRARLRGLPRRARASSAPSSTATPTPATRSPAPPRSRRSRSSSASARSSGWSRRSTLFEQLLRDLVEPLPARRRGAPARLHVRHRARRRAARELPYEPGRAWATR